MIDILSIIPGKKKRTSSGWHSFNGICCQHRGHNPDRRMRAGIKFTTGDQWSMHCFNCGFKCGLQVGKHFSKNLKQLLGWCGVDEAEIERLSFQSFAARSALDDLLAPKTVQRVEFSEVPLPEGARRLDPLKDEVHIQYLAGRGLSPDSYPYYVVDGEARQRLIIPFFYGGKIVGNTSRYYDGRHPKYISENQRGYVFNIDAQRPEWNVCILVEGQFDAISIDGCACMSNTLTGEQLSLLKGLNRKIIYVPDRDKPGLEACNAMLDYGFHISIPDWAPDVKDVNDAVKRYGKLPTLLSILGAETGSRIIVEMKRKKLL